MPESTLMPDQTAPQVGDNIAEVSVNKLARTPAEVTKKPGVEKTRYHRLNGKFGSGTHGGKLVPLAFCEYLAGAKVKNAYIDCVIKMQPISHLTFDRLDITFFVIYCPNSRVWIEADRFLARKDDVFNAPPDHVPVIPTAQLNMANPVYSSFVEAFNYHLPETTLWRDSIMYYYTNVNNADTVGDNLNINVLPLRQYDAIYNDIFRPRDISPPAIEYNGDTVDNLELLQWLRFGYPRTSELVLENDYNGVGQLKRMPSAECYENMYRQKPFTDDTIDFSSRLTHIQSQQLTAEFRSQAENFHLTDEQIIAKLRGTEIADENMPQIIGQKSMPIHLDFQPQTVEGELYLGADGAFSYTFCNEYIPLNFIDGRDNAPREGYLHFMYAITTPDGAIYQEAVPIEITKHSYLDFYRPDVGIIKDTPLYMREVFGSNWGDSILGWRRMFGEYFKLSNFIRGDFPVIGQSLGWVGAPREDRGGFYTINLAGDSPINLPTTKAWNMLGTTSVDAQSTNYMNKFDWTDVFLRRLLVINGQSWSTMSFNRLTNQTFMLYGSYGLDIAQPIKKEIKRNFINWSEE